MKKVLFTSYLLIVVAFCYAQKNYDYADTRKKNESFAKIAQKDIRADIATFALAGVNESIGKAALTKLSFSSFGADFMLFKSDTINVQVTLAPFDPAKHRLDYDEKYLTKIDRKTYYGDYSLVPKTFIKNLTLVLSRDTIAIPPSSYADLYNLNLTYTDKGTERTANTIYRSKDGHKIYLYFFSKSAKGNYEVTWVFQDRKFLRRVLDYDFL